jgi:arylsulfatase A-like enzyme
MARRPNVLLITLDQFRADCLGVAGHPLVRTPNLDRLALQGVRFANHFSNCAPCGPARASLLTGLWLMNHRVTANGAPLADDLPMLPRLLRDLGYRPTLFGYTDTSLDPRTLAEDDPRRRNWEEAMSGFDVGVMLDEQLVPWLEWLRARGVDAPDGPDRIYRPADVPVPQGRGATWRPTRYGAEHTESAFITEVTLEWLDQQDATAAWCAHVSYLRPHPPYIAPAPYHDMFDPADVPPPVRRESPEAERALHPFMSGALAAVPAPRDDLDQRQLAATYFGMIAEVDHQVGLLLDGLDERGLAEETLVVLTSDHGEQLGDHWLIEKLGFFDQSYRVPLMIRWPQGKGAPGTVINEFTESVDVLPTILDVVGGAPPDFCDGLSLRPFLDGEHPSPPARWRDSVQYEYDFRDPRTDAIERFTGLRQDQCAISVIRDGHGKYVHFAGGLPSLFFDLDEDPGELVDRSADRDVTDRVLDYARRLLTLRLEHTDPRMANTRVTTDGPLHRADPPRPAAPSR